MKTKKSILNEERLFSLSSLSSPASRRMEIRELKNDKKQKHVDGISEDDNELRNIDSFKRKRKSIPYNNIDDDIDLDDTPVKRSPVPKQKKKIGRPRKHAI